MTRLNAFQLRKAIKAEEFDYTLLSGMLSQYSGPRQKIHALLRDGVIIRVKKGLYVFAPEYNQVPVCKELLANLIYGPSCISLEFALAFYGLIPERVEVLTSVTPKRDKTFDTPLGRFSYRYLSIKKYSTGISQVWIDNTHPVFMASMEKALCDYVVLNKVHLFQNHEEAHEFLEADLRLARENWKKFDLQELQALNTLYRSKNIDLILFVLKQGGKA